MALSEEDKIELAQLISTEVARQVAEQAARVAPSGIDIRHIGVPIDTRTLRPPVAADQCCNGCD